MKQVYVKCNGKKVSVTVTDEVESVLKETRREIWRNEAKERYHCELSLDAMTDKDERTASAELNPETMLIAAEKKAERGAKLAVALKTLTAEQSRLAVLIYVKNMPLKEIAGRYGITYQAVQNRLKKILGKLKKFF
jgi:RNA polymerase sigma factor (sigma-70 family)